MKKVIALSLFCVTAALCLSQAAAADNQPVVPPGQLKKIEAKKAGKNAYLPFRGEVKAVDQAAKTFQVGERTFNVTGDTKIFKAKQPATFEEVKVGEYVTGSLLNVEGKLNVRTLNVGRPVGASKKSPAQPKQ